MQADVDVKTFDKQKAVPIEPLPTFDRLIEEQTDMFKDRDEDEEHTIKDYKDVSDKIAFIIYVSAKLNAVLEIVTKKNDVAFLDKQNIVDQVERDLKRMETLSSTGINRKLSARKLNDILSKQKTVIKNYLKQLKTQPSIDTFATYRSKLTPRNKQLTDQFIAYVNKFKELLYSGDINEELYNRLKTNIRNQYRVLEEQIGVHPLTRYVYILTNITFKLIDTNHIYDKLFEEQIRVGNIYYRRRGVLYRRRHHETCTYLLWKGTFDT